MKIPAACIVAQILSSADAFSSYNFPTNRASALPTLPQSASLSSSSPIFFQQQTKSPRSQTTQIRYSNGNSDNSNYLLDEFRTADGEIVNPYRVLKVGRHADRKEIRQSYRSLSKKYHPDGARFREVLPGSCNDQDDIRAEWERVKFSYEILIDKKLRMKYDRHSALNDPAAAVGRMAVDTLGWGMTSLAKGIFQIGDLAAKSVREKKDNNGATADDNNSVSGTHSHSDNGTYRNAPGASRFEMQGNAAVFTLPAPTLQQEIMSRIHVFFKSEAIVETKDVTCIVVGWAMKIIGRSIFDLGRSATNHASKM